MAEPVILLHGLLMRSPAMWPMAQKLRRQGFATLRFDYGTLWRTPARAMERLALLLYGFGQGPVHLVGHSLGGLIALETLHQYQGLPAGRVVCLGAPLQGSTAARRLADLKLGAITGRSGPLLRGGLIQLPPGREVAMIAGVKSMGMGRLVAGFDGLNDGSVAVWETRLPGLREHCVIRASHSGLVFSAEAAALTASFLRTGAFQ